MKVIILIDYDNLLMPQKEAGILDIVNKTLLQLPRQSNGTRGTCEVRIYGGWYEGELMSKLAQKIAVTLQDEFPTVRRLSATPHGITPVTVTAELALALLEEPTHNLIDTYRRKGKPANIRVQRPEDVSCTNPACQLMYARKLLQSGKCSVGGCNVSDESLVYRHEQKIVDTMLTCDLIYLANRDYDYVLLISGDDDFLPPIRTLLLRGMTVYRVHPQPNRRKMQPVRSSGTLVELEL